MKFTEACCVECRFAMKDVLYLPEGKVSCAEGYGFRGKLQKACRMFEAGNYEPEPKKGGTV